MSFFDFTIGNPPYQESGENNNKAGAVYHHFYEEAAKISDRYLLITPARFLFNAGLTPKDWNKKMLSDEHIKVEDYYHDSSEVFANANINGGVAIVYRDKSKSFVPIETFIPDNTLRRLAERFSGIAENSLGSIMYGGRSDLKFNDVFLSDFPQTKDYILASLQKKHPGITSLGPNEEYEIKSSSFERTPYAFVEKTPKNSKFYYRILGIENGKRTYKWVKRKYLTPRYPDRNNIEDYKLFISKADGAAGQIGKPIPARIIGRAEIGEPGCSSMHTFISIGNFRTRGEAENAEKYIRTKFVRALIGILKVTQDITPEKCKYVPLQDFTDASDIDWKKSIAEIDRQLYGKYGLDQSEIDFIESHIKEME